MGNIKKDWYIYGNEFSASLGYLCAEIRPAYGTFNLRVIDTRILKDMNFDFYNLADAFSFAEQDIVECNTLEEVKEKYNNIYNINGNSNTISLCIAEIEEAIISYFAFGKIARVEQEVLLEKGQPKVNFYLKEYIKQNNIFKEKRTTLLTDEDLTNAFSNYVSFYGYELEEFKYIGGVHNVGYYFDERTPHFDGIRLYVKKAEKQKTREI